MIAISKCYDRFVGGLRLKLHKDKNSIFYISQTLSILLLTAQLTLR